jgi:hypothetical protein
MRKVKATLLAVPVKVIRNTAKGSPNDSFAMIIHARTGVLLHRGQLPYIRKVAAERYNVIVDL